MTEHRWPMAYVMDSDPQALSIIRDLGRHGVPVITLTYKPHSPGRFTRYAQAQVLPRVDEHADTWLAHLLQEGKRHGQRSVLIPCTDRFVEFVSRNRAALEPYFITPLPSAELLEAIFDKRRQYELAQQAGIPIPRTIYPTREEDLAQLRDTDWSYPCILKPAKSHLWVRSYGDGSKLCTPRSHDELMERYRDARRRHLDVLVQEWIPGGADALYSLYFYSDGRGRIRSAGAGRKLRQYPISSGNGTLREAVEEPKVVELGKRLIRALGFHGIGNVEFMKDPRDGEFKLMELNVRPALGGQVLIAGGLHFPYVAYRDLIGQPVESQFRYRAGLKWWYLETDFQAFKALRRQGQLSTWSWLWSLGGVRSFAHFAWDDPKPFMVAMRTFIWKWRQGQI